MSKPKIGFLYKKDHYAFTGNYFDNTFYNFFFKALKRNKLADIIYIAEKEVFDCKDYINKIDGLIMFDPTPKGCPRHILNLDLFKGPKFYHAVDSHHALSVIGGKYGKRRIDYYRDLGLKDGFTHHNPMYYHKYFPKEEFNHYHIFPGFEPEYYSNLKPFKDRRNDKVLCTGALNAGFYHLRRKMCGHRDVIHKGQEAGFVGDRFPLLLAQYQSSVAAAGFSLVMKFIEAPAAGCLTFFGETPTNELHLMGVIDGVHGVIINDSNCFQKVDEYIATKNDPKWEEMAKNGRDYFWRNYSSDAQATKLLSYVIERI